MVPTPTTTATPPTAMARGPLTPSPFAPACTRPTPAALPLPTLTAWPMHPPTSTTARGLLTPSLRPTTAAATATATAGGMAVMVMAAGTTGKLKNRRTELSRLAQAIFYESIKNLQKNKFRKIENNSVEYVGHL